VAFAVGQYIVETQSLFTADPFSHTRTGQPWFYPKLGQVLWYGLFALAGWVGLSLGCGVGYSSLWVSVADYAR